MDPVVRRLTRLSEPPAPATLAANVMARIARESEFSKVDRVSRASASRRAGWAWAAAGVAIVLGLTVQGFADAASHLEVFMPRTGFGAPVLRSRIPNHAVLLVLGVLLFLAGLFAPLRREH